MDILWQPIIFLSRFATQIFFAGFLFTPVIEKRRYFWLRAILCFALYSAVPYLLPGKLYQFEYLRFGWLNLNWLLVFLLQMASLAICFRLNVKGVLFYGTASYAMQHILRQAGLLVCETCGLTGTNNLFYLTIVLVSLPLYAGFYFFLVRRIKMGEKINVNSLALLLLSVSTMSVVYVLSIYNMYYGFDSAPTVRLLVILACILLLAIQFSLFQKSRADEEKEAMAKMLHEKEDDLIFSRKNIDLINLKCHNLKHEIGALRTMEDAKRNEKLDEIEKEVLFYDNTAKTGNQTLDVILTEKSLYCEKHQIKLNYQVDSEKIRFIEDTDLYVLIGNLLDNAIESLLKIKNKDERVVFLRVLPVKNFISIHSENKYEGELKFVNGLPETTKGDKEYHGYGLRSIQYIVDKYKGNMTIDAKDGTFKLTMLLPIPESAPTLVAPAIHDIK